MSTIQICLCALLKDIEQNNNSLDVQAAQKNIVQINQYFKSDITFIESEVALKTLFDDNGIVKYAKAVISLNWINTKIILVDIIFLILQLIESFPKSIVHYINLILDLCNACIITTKKSADLTIKVYQIFYKLLEFKNFSDQIEISIIIEHLNNEVSLGDKISPTVRQHVYNLFGVIAQYHPMYLRSYEDKLINLFCFELHIQIELWEKNGRKFLPPVAIGCLNGLTGFLSNFSDYIETHDYCIRLYEILKKLIGTVEEKKRHLINRTGLNLFQKHINLFLKLIFQDATEVIWLQKKLWDWCILPNLEDKKNGVISFEVLHKGASVEFTKHFITDKPNIRNTQQKIIQNMILFLKSKVFDEKLNYEEHAIIVRSIGWLSEPCNTILGEECLIEIFTILSLKAEEKYLNCVFEKSYDPNAANYLNSLSLIIRNLTNLSSDQILLVQRLSIYCFNDFITAHPKSAWQDNIMNAIIVSIYCFASSHGNILDIYLKKFFYVGLIKSCSHRTVIDAEIVEEYTGHVLIRSTNYVPLWVSVLKAHQCHSFDSYLNVSITVKLTLEKSLMCNFMSSVLKIIKTLDLFTSKSENELEVEYVARKPSDFTALVNLVQIYSEVLNELELDVETSSLWLPYTLNVIINHSIELLTVSSFYKLLTILFQRLDWYMILKNNKYNSCKEKIIEYFKYVLEYIHTFKGDLQFCCLEMIMSMPSLIVKEVFSVQILEVIKTALIVGSTNLPLAKCAVYSLKRWHQNLLKNEMDQLLKCIMPYLDLLLRTKGYDGEVELDNSVLDQMQAKNKKTRKLIKQNKLFIKPETELEIIQIEILEFLAQLDTSTCLKLIEDPDVFISYPINIINYTLPFHDCKFNVSFDNLLPRVMELCQFCSNRQIRLIACETFHAYITLYLGNNLILERSKPTEMKIITHNIIPIVLKLACDMDNLVQQLFEPLIVGIVHYFASSIQFNSIYSPLTIDILLNSVSDNSNEAVKELSAKCIKEFVHWTLKDKNICHRSSSSLCIIIKKIEQFCMHSDPNKQLGAAIAFNSCYFILREEENIINELWIQFLYYFVLILNSTTSTHSEEHVLKSIDHLQRVFLEKSNLFNEINVLRLIPKSFNGTQLLNVVEWLLKYIGSPLTKCRSKCLNMAISLSKQVKDHHSLKSILDSFLISYGEKELISYIEQDLNTFINLKNFCSASFNDCLNVRTSVNLLIKWLNQLNATFECYTSLFKEIMIDIKLLKCPYSCLFQSVHYFLFQIEEFSLIQWLTSNTNLPVNKCNTDFQNCERNFITLKHSVIVGLFQFIYMFENDVIYDLLDDVIKDKMYDLAIKYLFEYDKILLFSEKLKQYKIIVQFIKKVCCSNNNYHSKLNHYLIKNWSKLVSNLNLISECTVNNNFLHGNQLIFESKIFSSTDLETIVHQKYILEIIFNYVYNNGIIIHLESAILSYLEHLLDLVINLDYKDDLITLLIMDTRDMLDSNTKKKVMCGQYFFSVFNRPISEYYLNVPDNFVNKLFVEYSLNDQSFKMILDILKTSNNKKMYDQGKILIEKIVNNSKYCEKIQNQLSWNNIYELVEIATNVVDTLRNKKLIFLQNWICNNLNNNNLNIYYKSRLLIFLPKLVSNKMDNESLDNDIKKCLTDFKDKHFSGVSSKFKLHSIELTNLVTVFQKILKAMESSSSYLLFEVVIEWCIKDPNHECIERVKNSLQLFFNRLSDEIQFLCCKFVYEKFKNEVISESRRQMIINTFLIPILSYCRKKVITNMYKHMIDFILRIINENLLANDSGKARHLLISKIGCFKLIEEIFGFYTNAELSNNSTIPFISSDSQSVNLITQFRNSAVKIRYINVDYSKGSNEIQQLFRKLHCYSYNALVTIINNTENDINKYTIFLFNERPPKQFIWRNLVDCNICHEFPIDFETIPQRKRNLINIRTKYNQNIPKVYIDLNSHLKNTLVEDLENYDYNDSYLRSNMTNNCLLSSKFSHQMLYVELEMDSFNNHECMAHLCATIKYLTSEKNLNTGMPDWMKSLKLAFCDKSPKTINSKILLVKLIVNCETNFEPYAIHWLSPLMQFIVDRNLGNNLNYFIIDVVSMLVSWHNIAIPSTQEDKLIAKQLFSFLLGASKNENKNVFKHNMELIKFIVEHWKLSLEVDYDVLLSLLVSNEMNDNFLECGLHLIGILSANGILPFNEHNTKNFISLLMECIHNKNQVIYLLSSEIFGMLLKICHDNSMNESDLLQYLSPILKFSENMNATKVLSCLYCIQKHYSKILDNYIDDLFNIFDKIQGIHQTQCLEMFLNTLSVLHNPYEKITKLTKFFNSLKDKGTDDQLICLKITLQLIPSIHVEEVVVLIKFVADIFSHQHNFNSRKLIYDIMCKAYELYLGNNSEASKEILKNSKNILLKGLTDNDDELRQHIFRFWVDSKRLPLKCIDRLLILLDQLYSPDTESHFLGNLVSILLESCRTALDYDQKIFQYPLHDCEFEDYKLTVSWRANNSTIPKYADTIASQLNYSNTLKCTESDLKQRYQIKKTLTFQFQPTLVQTQFGDQKISALESYSQVLKDEANTSTLNDMGEQNWNQSLDNKHASESDFIQKKKIRLIRNKSMISKQFAIKNIKMNVNRENFKKERVQKRESSVNIFRKYRIGDFPDIEITNESVIKPLTELAKRDSSIARIILSSIMHGFKNNPKIDQQYFECLNSCLNNMIEDCHYNPSFVGFILDTAYCYPGLINLDPNRVTEVATSCGLMSLGALIIETSINYLQTKHVDIHIEKKSKKPYEHSDVWIKLAEIYKNMGELDVVEGILQEKINNLSCDSLKEALKAEQSDDWRSAQKKFKSVLECSEPNIFLEGEKDFVFEEFYKCSEHLSDWNEINKMLKLHTGKNYEKIWDKNWYKEHLLPRVLHSELHEIFNGMTDGNFIETFSNWLNDKHKEEYILNHVATEACMLFFCCDDLNKAQLWCKLRMRDFLKEWENISPQYYKLRADQLLSLQTLSEIYYFTKLFSTQSNNTAETIRRLIQPWQSKFPIDSDSLRIWDIKILYRSFFFNKIKSSISELPFDEQLNLKQILNKYEVEPILAFIESAINKNNFYIAKKYMNDYRFENIENWKSDFLLCRSKILAMSSCYSIDSEKKLKCYLNSWSELDDIKEQCSPLSLMKIHIHVANISKNISNTIRDISDINLLSNDLKLAIMNKIKSNVEFGSLDEVLKQIDSTIINNIKSGLFIALNHSTCTKIIIDTYLMLAQYCLEEINRKENIEDCQKQVLFIDSVLKAMKYGAKKSSELFPVILQFKNLSENALKDTFIKESQNVPEYMFLPWINQILGCLDSSSMTLIGPLLIRVSQIYPKAIQLPIRIYMEKDKYNNEQCERFLKTKLVPLIHDINLDMFIEAINNVCCPLMQLLEYINDIQESMKTNCSNLIILGFKKLFNDCFITEKNQKFKGNEFKSLDLYKESLKVILDQFELSMTDIKDSFTALEKIRKSVISHKEENYNKKKSTYLNDYCPWFAQFSKYAINTLEIPGQYSGLKHPNPDNHISISSIKPHVQVMHSLRNPIKITMIGNNGEKYSFLVKFGEDLRQDQRIEQLLQVMSDTLSENTYCCERQLSLLTYTVLPISKRLGMIEWINNTITLKDFICESFSDGKESGIKQLHSNVIEHNRWISEKSVPSNMLKMYTRATIEYNSIVTAAKFKQLVQSIPADILRKSLINMCHCAEMYVCLRSKFITSYSVLSICHWLLGIGDRHLNNTIVSKKTGHCIGIDFNFAFHTATSIQIVPELIPFRMSPHIVSLMAPLNLTGFIRETMVHTLKTLIDNRDILLSVMQVFINDPSADWIKMAKTETLRIYGDFDCEIHWFPKKKILLGKEKLNGMNPIAILSLELENSRIPNDYKNALLSILKNDSQNKAYRRSMLPKCVTPNQQVDCLLDLAMDEHILGKAYGGLELWV